MQHAEEKDGLQEEATRSPLHTDSLRGTATTVDVTTDSKFPLTMPTPADDAHAGRLIKLGIPIPIPADTSRMQTEIAETIGMCDRMMMGAASGIGFMIMYLRMTASSTMVELGFWTSEAVEVMTLPPKQAGVNRSTVSHQSFLWSRSQARRPPL